MSDSIIPEDEEDDRNWRLLDTYQTQKFLEEVHDEEFAGLFQGPAYELVARNLHFFDGYEHYVLCNRLVFPYFSLHYLSNGENHYFLDGSEHPLEMLVDKESLRLKDDNILEYLQFHSDVTFYPYRKVKFILDPTNTPYSGASAMGHHFKSLKIHAKMGLEYNEKHESFYVRMPVLYNGETVEGYVQVKKTGEITILEPVNVPLMDRSNDHKPLDYDHPHEKELLQQNLDILTKSEEGKRLYETVKSYSGEIRVVSAVGSNGYAAGKQLGYILAPERLDTYSPYQVIALAGVLRGMELNLMGRERPDPYEDKHEVVAQNLGLNLDILLELCIIIDELAKAGHDEILTKFKESGFESFYSGYKNDVSDKELLAITAAIFGLDVQGELPPDTEDDQEQGAAKDTE